MFTLLPFAVPPETAVVLGNGSPYGVEKSMTLTCSVTGGTPTPNVQWVKNGADVGGQTSSTYSFPAQAGSYACRAANTHGSVTSAAQSVTVHGRLSIIF